jgi:hypothetical protein
LAIDFFTLTAFADTIRAGIFLAIGALPAAAYTGCLFALATVRRTLGTKIPFAVVAVVGILRIHGVSAIVTRCAIPIIQCDIRTVRVVGGEDASDHCEKVTKSTLFQAGPYCRSAVTLTNSLATDVRMSNAVIRSCRIWVECDHMVRMVLVQLAELV